jgi:hypothetical protein
MYKILNADIKAVNNGNMLEDFNPSKCRKITHDSDGNLRSEEEKKKQLDWLVESGVVRIG